MADESYDVGARVTLDTRASSASARRLISDLDTLGARIRGNNMLLSSMSAKLLGIGGAYLGFNAIKNAAMAAGRAMFRFEAETGRTKIGLASVFSAVENLSFGRAETLAEKVFGQLQDDAIESVATTQELFDIYSGIVGPIRAAGFELEKVRDITKDTVNASAALNVDFPQAKRDIAAMTRGAAGMDVKMFQTLRSMNLIKEDAKEFNALTAKNRIERIADALKKAGVGGQAFGRSLPGRISTFVDIAQSFSRAFSGPIFESFASRLGKVNDYLLGNRGAIVSYLQRVGTDMSLRFETVFDRATEGAKWLHAHWAQIADKIADTANTMREVAPQLAKAYLGLAVGRQVLGGGMQAAAPAGALGLRFGGAADVAGAVAQVASGASKKSGIGLADLEMRRSHLAAWNAGKDLGQASMLYQPEVIGFGKAGFGASSAVGAGEAGVAATAAAGSLGAATVAMIALGVAAAAAGSIFYALHDSWHEGKAVLIETLLPLEEFWGQLKTLGGHLWDIVKPLVRVVGGALFIGLANAIQAAVVPLEILIQGVNKLAGWFAELGRMQDEVGQSFMAKVLEQQALNMRVINDLIFGKRTLPGTDILNTRGPQGTRRFGTMPEAKPPKTPDKRPGPYNDFRGSKFTIKQEFRDADPDRILRVFVRGLEKQAERRTQSPFAPAFTR